MKEFGKCAGGGRRAAPREVASLLARYATVTRSRSAMLVDVSSTGARLRTPHLPHEGDELFVTIGRVKAFGSVAWVREGEFAMAFDEPLNSDDLLDLRNNVRAGLGLPPDVKSALDDWVLGTR
jgi:hypothetical protein